MQSPHKKIPPATRFRLNRQLIDSPAFAPAFLRTRASMRPLLVNEGSHLVVDGFPRSANSYAYYAFKQAVGPNVVVSGHTHSSVTIRKAARLGLPTVLLIREPRASIASLVQFVDGLEPAVGFSAYARFHGRVIPVAKNILIVRFETIIDDLPGVMEECNRRFHSDFRVYSALDEAEESVREALIAANTRFNAGKSETLASPSSTRRGADEILEGMGRRAEVAEARAMAMFNRLLPLAM